MCRGGLAVGAGDSGDLQLRRRVAVEQGTHEGHRTAHGRHENLRNGDVQPPLANHGGGPGGGGLGGEVVAVEARTQKNRLPGTASCARNTSELIESAGPPTTSVTSEPATSDARSMWRDSSRRPLPLFLRAGGSVMPATGTRRFASLRRSGRAVRVQSSGMSGRTGRSSGPPERQRRRRSTRSMSPARRPRPSQAPSGGRPAPGR